MRARGVALLAVVFLATATLGSTGCTLTIGKTSGAPADGGVVTATASAASPSPTPPSASASASAAPSPSLAPTSSPSRGATPVPVRGPGQKLVVMTISGGFAGVHQEVTLRGDATVLTRGRGGPVVYRAGAARFRELRILLGDPELEDVPDFTMNMSAHDMFQYTLQFNGRTIMTDRSSELPALERLINALSRWLPKS
ncbi:MULTISPECIES: hypothetical protein [unclassified Streptomyces]|uniref:hypothetical protein n=1 Tax=unclassified Streptomyces TaxID=2593676 RepID=UPI0003A5276B|nr:hypothetical protein [Streptomyces sp. BoleA5]MYX37955.1 hypothetical protein [Streptomyces sp. SID8377]